MIKSNIEKRKIKKYNDEVNKVYSDVLDNLVAGKTKFINRVNNTINISTTIEIYGLINIVYLLDRKDVAIFINEKCIYTSDLVDKDILASIAKSIDIIYKEDINDIVDLMGIIFSREDFERKFKVKVADLKGMFNVKFEPQKEVKSDIDNIVTNNKNKFDIDDILDRINSIGLDNLTKEEKKFLDNYKK